MAEHCASSGCAGKPGKSSVTTKPVPCSGKLIQAATAIAVMYLLPSFDRIENRLGDDRIGKAFQRRIGFRIGGNRGTSIGAGL